ncbi:hypothetical protein M8C21_008744, partial [Ambrosia artemisiifolia]
TDLSKDTVKAFFPGPRGAAPLTKFISFKKLHQVKAKWEFKVVKVEEVVNYISVTRQIKQMWERHERIHCSKATQNVNWKGFDCATYEFKTSRWGELVLVAQFSLQDNGYSGGKNMSKLIATRRH